MSWKILAVGDHALQIEWNEKITEALNQKIQLLTDTIMQQQKKGIIEVVPALKTITVFYNPLELTYIQAEDYMQGLLHKSSKRTNSFTKTLVTIPVCYGGDFGPDIERVAKHNHLTIKEVIKQHSQPRYLVHMLGFLPGFPYLTLPSATISTPRLANPRHTVPVGAVGIGGNQTGIYPIASPGGWNLIGKTPVKLFDLQSEIPFLLKAGDYLTFKEITEEEYQEISIQIEENKYQVIKDVIQDEH